MGHRRASRGCPRVRSPGLSFFHFISLYFFSIHLLSFINMHAAFYTFRELYRNKEERKKKKKHSKSKSNIIIRYICYLPRNSDFLRSVFYSKKKVKSLHRLKKRTNICYRRRKGYVGSVLVVHIFLFFLKKSG